MSKKNDLKLVVESKETAFWMHAKKACESRIAHHEDNLKIELAVLDMYNERIELSKAEGMLKDIKND